MKKKIKYGIILLLVVNSMIFNSYLYGQNKKMSQDDLERMYKYADSIMYDNPDKAFQLANKILNSEIDKNNKIFANTNALIAEIYSGKGDQKKSIMYSETAKNVYSSLGYINQSIDMSLMISRQYSELGLFDEAIRSNDEAVTVIKSRVQKDKNENNIKLLAQTYDTRSYVFDQKMIKDSMIKYNELAYENFLHLKPSKEKS